MCVFLLTNQEDITTDYVVRELSSREIEFHRVNTDSLDELSVSFEPSSSSFQIVGKYLDVDSSRVTAAYFRRPKTPKLAAVSTAYRQYAQSEWNSILHSIISYTENCWLNHPNHIQFAEDKPKQLKLAHDIGFLVPETYITNCIEKAKSLSGRYSMIAKPLKQALVKGEDRDRVIFTTSVTRMSDSVREAVQLCPVIYQQRIPKTCDIRVTVVGESIFPVAIHSQNHEETRVDWRRGSNPNLTHEVIDLPYELKDMCVKFVKMQQLRFGAIDLVKDLNGNYWFLECNPNGQWAWIEHRTGLPIASAIVDELVSIANRKD